MAELELRRSITSLPPSCSLCLCRLPPERRTSLPARASCLRSRPCLAPIRVISIFACAGRQGPSEERVRWRASSRSAR
jgi:hypothetical protein